MAESFTLSIATPEDDSLISQLLEDSYPVLMRPNYDKAVIRAALLFMTRANPALLSSGTYYLVKNEDERLIGCGGWTRERPGDGEIAQELAHIRHFATHPEWLRRGVGRAIYGECEKAARSRSMRRFECYASLNAERFYTALGFKSVQEIEVPLAQDTTLPAIRMVRSI